MRKNINFLVTDLGASQQNYYLINNINKIHDEIVDLNINIFSENLSRFCLPVKFSVMSVAEAWAQEGPFVSTNFSTTSKLIKYPRASHKLFYIWDLEFLRGEGRIYDIYAPIYLNKEIELICRSEDHKKIVENTFNRNVKYIVENFDIEKILDIIKHE
jgi:hypothetical protein